MGGVVPSSHLSCPRDEAVSAAGTEAPSHDDAARMRFIEREISVLIPDLKGVTSPMTVVSSANLVFCLL